MGADNRWTVTPKTAASRNRRVRNAPPRWRSTPAAFVGLDLAGSEKRQTGLCFLSKGHAATEVVYDDRQLLERLDDLAPTYIGIDAPLFLPAGRCCLRNDCTCPRDIHFRQCDLELRRRKIRFFPITLGPMRQLTMRGIRLAERLKRQGHTILETYPGAAQDIWGIPRQRDPKGLRRGLGKMVTIRGRGLTCHELDAITCARLAELYHEGRAELIGREDEGWMVLPGNPKT